MKNGHQSLLEVSPKFAKLITSKDECLNFHQIRDKLTVQINTVNQLYSVRIVRKILAPILVSSALGLYTKNGRL